MWVTFADAIGRFAGMAESEKPVPCWPLVGKIIITRLEKLKRW